MVRSTGIPFYPPGVTMAVYDLYSKRRKREQGEVSDVFTYAPIPTTLRNQIIGIWGEAIGIPGVNPRHEHFSETVRSLYHGIASALRREYGLVMLSIGGNP